MADNITVSNEKCILHSYYGFSSTRVLNMPDEVAKAQLNLSEVEVQKSFDKDSVSDAVIAERRSIYEMTVAEYNYDPANDKPLLSEDKILLADHFGQDLRLVVQLSEERASELCNEYVDKEEAAFLEKDENKRMEMMMETPEDIFDDTFEIPEPSYVPLVFCGRHDDYDLPEILEKLETNKHDVRYGTEPYSMFNLSHDVMCFSNIDWNKYPGSAGLKNKIRHNLAETLAYAEMNDDKNRFDYIVKMSELGKGEVLSRNIDRYKMMLSSHLKANHISETYAERSQTLASRMLKKECDAYTKYREGVYADDEKLYEEEVLSEIDSAENEQTMRNLIYKDENISPEIADRDLPWYVSERMEQAGISLEK